LRCSSRPRPQHSATIRRGTSPLWRSCPRHLSCSALFCCSSGFIPNSRDQTKIVDR
jgi:hypothetical protein